MSQRKRRGFTAAQKTELWNQWQQGLSLKAIGRALGKHSSSIYGQLAPVWGHTPSAATPLAVSADGDGAGGDLQRDSGVSIDPLDRLVTGPVTVHGEPGNRPQWGLLLLPSDPGR